MLLEFKTQFSNTAAMLDCVFTTKNHSEYEDYAQGYAYANASVNLMPVRSYTAERTVANTTRYKGNFEIYFLKKFSTSNNFDDTKDVIIDEMISLSEAFYAQLNQNAYLLFDMPFWVWRADILRQYTANALCGVKVTITFDTACNRLDGSEPVPSLPVIIRSSQDGGYIIYGQSSDSPFIIPGIRYQVGANPVVQIPFTDQIISIPDECQTLTELWNASTTEEKIVLYIALSDADLIALYLALTDAQRLVMQGGLNNTQLTTLYLGLSDAQRIVLQSGLSSAQLFALYDALNDAQRIVLFQTLSTQNQIDIYTGLTDAQRIVLQAGLSAAQLLALYDAISNAQRLTLLNGISTTKKEQLLFYTYNYPALYSGQVTSYQTGDDKHQWDNIYTPEINSWPTDRVWVFASLDPTNFNLLKRGATASGNNIFGNLQRFTDDLGGQTYASGVLIDHYLGIMKDITFSSASTFSTSISNALARTFYSKTDWRVGGEKIWQLFTKRAQNGNYLAGLPSITFLNVPANSGDRFIWTSTSTDGSLTTLADIYILRQTDATLRRNAVGSLAKLSSVPQNLYIRKCFTYNSGTGLMQLS